MTNFPAVLVKYFNADCDWDFYEKGSFRLGTLTEYAKNEMQGERFSDTSEGTYDANYGRGACEAENLDLGGIRIKKLVSFNPGTPGTSLHKLYEELKPVAIHMKHRFNCNVFCASAGTYSLEHHAKMREQTESGAETYLGNVDLTGWAEIDMRKFVLALGAWARANSEYPEVKAGKVSIIQCKCVRYHKAPLEMQLDDARISNRNYEEMVERICFDKPIRFSVEQEFRVCLTSHPYQNMAMTSPIFPVSDALKMSIIRKGRI